MSYIFISYSRKNRADARRIADEFLRRGYDVWIDDRIDYGQSWERVIFDAIDKCAAFVVIMTPDSYQSDWVLREIQYADRRHKPQFPILLQGENFPRFGPTQVVNLTDGNLPPEAFYRALSRHVPPGKTGSMAAPPPAEMQRVATPREQTVPRRPTARIVGALVLIAIGVAVFVLSRFVPLGGIGSPTATLSPPAASSMTPASTSNGTALPSIVQFLAADGRFDFFLDALDVCGLTPDVEDPTAEFTVFAPTDDALANSDVAMPTNVNDDICNIIANHIVTNRYTLQDLMSRSKLQTLANDEVVLTQSSDGLLIGGVPIMTAEQAAFNAVIHILTEGALDPGANAATAASITDLPAQFEGSAQADPSIHRFAADAPGFDILPEGCGVTLWVQTMDGDDPVSAEITLGVDDMWIVNGDGQIEGNNGDVVRFLGQNNNLLNARGSSLIVDAPAGSYALVVVADADIPCMPRYEIEIVQRED